MSGVRRRMEAKDAHQELLALPFAVVGLAGGALVGNVLSGGYRLKDAPFTLLVAICTAIVAAIFGRTLGRRLHGCNLGERTSRTIFGALLAGMVNAALVFICVVAAIGRRNPEALIGVPFAAIFGGVVAIPFMPPLCLVVHASDSTRDVRPASVLGDARRRAVWRAVAGSIAVASIVSIPRAGGIAYALFHHWPTQLAIVSTLAVMLLTLTDLAKVRQARTLQAQHAALPKAEPGQAPTGAPRLVDYGVGDEAAIETAPAVYAYREADDTFLVALGDPVRAVSGLKRGARGGLVALGLSSAVVVVHLMAARPNPVAHDGHGSLVREIDAHVD